MGEGSGEIIIKGGSIELSFDDGLYQKVPNDPGIYRNQNRRITRIVVEDEEGKVKLDSGEGVGQQWTITVSTE
jgi:hypothetical protein